jgi:tetratricopeptide (TPR) repeat protein
VKNSIKKLFQFSMILVSCYISAQNLYQNDLASANYSGAILTAEQKLLENPKDSLAYYIIGLSQTKLKNTTQAIIYLKKAKKGGFPNAQLNIYLAINYLAIGSKNEALVALDQAANGGATRFELLEDSQFNSLENSPRFQRIREKIKENAYPCKSDDNYTRFDFWVGDWDVYVGNLKIAESKISFSRGNCGILEDYQTSQIVGGNSLSYFDSYAKKWKQTYADQTGSVSYYEETDSPYGGTLQFISKSTIFQGNNSPTPWIKMTYYDNEDGSVRQYLETSIDEGKTWTSAFDAIYKRKPQLE